MRQKMYGRGANIQNLNQQTLSSLDIPVPPSVMQEQFAIFVAQVDKSKAVVQSIMDKLNTLQVSLMQEYFG
jgi:type I restriction enzyme S subunit